LPVPTVYARHIGRVGALAVALGVGVAVATTPGIAWADEPNAPGNEHPPSVDTATGSNGAQTPSEDVEPNGHDAGSQQGGTTGTTTTTTGSQTTTVIGGGSTPTVTYGNSGGFTTDDVKATQEPASATAATPTNPATPTPPPTVVEPTVTAIAPPSAVSTTATPTPTADVPPPPAASLNPDGSGTTQAPVDALALSTNPLVNFALGAPSGQDSDLLPTARSFAAHTDIDDADTATLFQANTFNALVAPALPVPAVAPPTLFETVIALPGTFISTALNLITQALTPLVGPGAPADNPVLWAVLAFVRRQFNQTFANSTPTLSPQQTSQGLSPVQGTFGGTDADGDTLTYAVATTGLGAPAQGTVAIDQATGTYTYTPTAGYVGEDYFFVTATDDTAGPHIHALGQTHLATARVDVTVAPSAVNSAPTITVTPGATDPASGSIRYTVATNDVNGDPVTVTYSQPVHGSITQSLTDTAVYVYAPDAAYAHSLHLGGSTVAGSDTITFTATDSHQATGAVTVTPVIASVNSAPTLTVLTENTNAANGAVKVSVTFADADGDSPLTGTISAPQHGYYAATIDGPAVPVAGTNPTAATIAGTTNTLYYIPDSTRPGVESLTFSLTDAYGGTVTKTAQVTVDATVNHAPTITVTTEPTSAANGTVKVTITYADADADIITLAVAKLEHGYYTNSIGGAPVPSDGQSGSVPAVPGGATASAYYVPDPTRPGVENISFTVTDPSGATATAAQQILVDAAVNHTPTVTLTTTPTGRPDGSVNVAFTFADADSDTVTLTLSTPEHGYYTNVIGGTPLVGPFTGPVPAVPASTPSTLIYVPDPTRPGVETITLTAIDPSGATATAAQHITVTGPASPVATVGTPDAITGVVTGSVRAPGNYGDTVTYSLITPPSAAFGVVDLDPTTGAFTFAPTLNALLAAYSTDGGTTPTAAFTISASDGQAVTLIAVSAPIGVSTDSLIQMVARDGSLPSAVAVGPDGTVYVTNSGANTLSIIDPTTNAITTTNVGRTPQAVTVGADGRAWVVNTGDNTVTVTNASGNTLHTVTVGQAPSAITLGTDGTAYVANSADNTVTVIDPTSYAASKTITVGTTPTGIATGADGRIYTANYGDGTITLIDPANGYATDTLILDGVNPYGITVGADGVMAVTDPLRNTVTLLTPTDVRSAPTGLVARSATATATANEGVLVVSSGGNQAYSLSTLTVTSTPTAITTGTDNTLYVTNSNGNTITTINPQATSTNTIQVGTNPNAVAIGSNGKLYVTNGGSDTLIAINPETTSTTTIPVGVDPSGVTVGYAGQLLVTNKFDKTAYVITPGSVSLPNFDIATVTTRAQPNTPVALPDGTIGYLGGGAIDFGPSGRLYVTGSVYRNPSNANTYVGDFVGIVDPDGITRTSALLPYDASGQNTMLTVSDDGRAYVAQVRGSSLYAVDLTGPGAGQVQEIYHSATGGLVYNIALGPDGRVYTFSRDYTTQNLSVVVIDAGNHTIQTIPAPEPSNSFITVGLDGRPYYLSGAGTLVTIDLHTSSVSTVGIGGYPVLSGLAIGHDGRIYLLSARQRNGEPPRLIVLEPDFSVDRILDLGDTTLDSQLVVGPDGRVYVPTYTGVAVVDPTTYSISAITLPGKSTFSTPLRARADGVYRESYDVIDDSTFLNASRIALPGAAPLPNAVDNAISDTHAPTSLTGLWNLVRERATGNDATGGVVVQTVRGQNGENRLIVYLGGTTTHDLFVGDQAPAENVSAVAGVLKPDQVQAIKDALDACAQDCPISEIMLVGYSQGGVDAQNLAAPNLLNPGNAVMLAQNSSLLSTVIALPSLVSTVITYGSPITTTPFPGDAVLHVQDKNDTVPKSVLPFDIAYGQPPGHFALFAGLARFPYGTAEDGVSGTSHPDDLLFGVHGDQETYRILSDRITYDTSGKHQSVKDAITRFQGTLITPGTLSGGGGGNGDIA
jgi:YVTN family beta-propeller protein